MTTLQDLREIITKVGLTNRSDSLLKHAKPAIQIKTSHVLSENEIGIGQSKMGGSPDLPVGINWPYWEDKPLTFIGQFRVMDFAPFDLAKELPKEGLLYFFYEANSQPWGFTPSDNKSGQVLYIKENSTPLARIPHPIAKGKYGDIKSLNPCKVHFSTTITMPSTQYIDLSQELEFSEAEIEKYWEILSTATHQNALLTWLLGYPDEIQNDMRLECQLASNGLYVGNSSGYNDPRRQLLEKDAKDWRLLLQVDSDENLGVMWADVGHIYYWIKAQDLKTANFDNIWLVLQCT